MLVQESDYDRIRQRRGAGLAGNPRHWDFHLCNREGATRGLILGIGGIIAALLVFTMMVGKKVSNLATYARNAGFQGVDLLTAVAVALAESGGNPDAYNPETAAGTPEGEGSYGLWQIYLHAHPEFQGQNLFDPQTNANAAYAVYRAAGNSFRPWSTYKNGAYTAHLDEAGQMVNA